MLEGGRAEVLTKGDSESSDKQNIDDNRLGDCSCFLFL